MIFSTMWMFPFASSSLAAVVQICRSVGIFSRALFNTFRAFSYVSKRARASHSSTLVPQHSTARESRIFASSGFSISTAAFQRRTELGMCSRALRNTRRFAFGSVSRSAALIQMRTEVGMRRAACAITPLAVSGGCSRAASSHRSSLCGFCSQPRMIRFRAICSLPVTSSRRAEAIQAGGWYGFVSRTLFSSMRAFLMSFMSPPYVGIMLCRSVK
uniref:Putative secreted protein n=1 Tax=Anopheles darlingi TaxID=43151 RepID=A0A2M4D234_ANODA